MTSSDPAGHLSIIDVDPDGLSVAFKQLIDSGHRLALVAAHHDVHRAGRAETMRIVYLMVAGPPDARVEIRMHVESVAPSVPSLAKWSFPASRFEREMQDLFGIVPTGHPQPARLVLHQHWPENWYPMRKDAGPPPDFGDESAAYPFLTVSGAGVYEIPVGPVHAGLIEPGHFRFSVVGETILNVRARLWFVHKGVERLFEGRTPAGGVALSERISGDSAVGHTLAYCLAVEAACNCTVPYPAQVLRGILLELERLYNHTADIGGICNDVGFGIANAHALRIRERLLRLNAEVTGHRLLRGGVFVGGATVEQLPSVETLHEIQSDLHEIVEIALANSTVRDRFTGTAVLTTEQASEIGVLGYVARASGVSVDARRSHPFADLYADLDVPVDDQGDVLARFSIRVAEFDASIALLGRLLAQATSHTSYSAPLENAEPGHGVGLVEGWRGTICHRVELDPAGTISRLKIVDPSFFNWPALPVALADTIVPDFPLANKSFNLSYAGNDL